MILSDRFRPRPFGPGRFRRASFRPEGFFGPAMRFLCPKAPVPPLPLCPKAPVPRRAFFGKWVRLVSAFAVPRVALLPRTPCQSPCRCFPFLRTSAASPRWQWLAACDPFPVRRLPATHASSQRLPSRASGFALWISRISGIKMSDRVRIKKARPRWCGRARLQAPPGGPAQRIRIRTPTRKERPRRSL